VPVDRLRIGERFHPGRNSTIGVAMNGEGFGGDPEK